MRIPNMIDNVNTMPIYCPLCGHLYGINFDHILGYFNVF